MLLCTGSLLVYYDRINATYQCFDVICKKYLIGEQFVRSDIASLYVPMYASLHYPLKMATRSSQGRIYFGPILLNIKTIPVNELVAKSIFRSFIEDLGILAYIIAKLIANRSVFSGS